MSEFFPPLIFYFFRLRAKAPRPSRHIVAGSGTSVILSSSIPILSLPALEPSKVNDADVGEVTITVSVKVANGALLAKTYVLFNRLPIAICTVTGSAGAD
jgi:hypothetical protein